MNAFASHPSASPLPPLASRLATFAYWGFWVGVAFFSVYPTTNWLSSLRPESTYAMYLPQELAIPFRAEFIWVYLSMYLLFFTPPFFLDQIQLKRLAKELIAVTIFAGLIFLLFPAQLGFMRETPADPLYASLFSTIFSLDRPFNLVPSLHVVYSTAISLAIMQNASRALRVGLLCWLILLVASTVLVHQHHLLDVFSGLVLAGFAFMTGRTGNV